MKAPPLTKPLFLTTLCAATCFASAQANLVVNGDFETDSYPGGTAVNLAAGSGSLTGWTVIGNAAGLGVGFNGNPTQELDLSGFEDRPNTGISQALNTTAGAPYTLTFNVYTNGSSSVDLFLDGNPLETQITGGRSDVKTFSFNAASTTTELTFLSHGGNVSHVDNVSVTSATPVPEPASLVALSAGGVALLRRRKIAR